MTARRAALPPPGPGSLGPRDPPPGPGSPGPRDPPPPPCGAPGPGSPGPRDPPPPPCHDAGWSVPSLQEPERDSDSERGPGIHADVVGTSGSGAADESSDSDAEQEGAQKPVRKVSTSGQIRTKSIFRGSGISWWTGTSASPFVIQVTPTLWWIIIVVTFTSTQTLVDHYRGHLHLHPDSDGGPLEAKRPTGGQEAHWRPRGPLEA
ncbi:hypothetical protein CRUP_037225 [Coryphaenoides rupestris]|nr:hypothetical protein CRUP_037225 [Coryphaenoides rupestris]